MTERLVISVVLVAGLCVLAACPPAIFETQIELLVAEGQEPLAGASYVEVEVRYADGEVVSGSLSTSPGPQRIEGLRPGSAVVIDVTARRSDGSPVALGRSLPLEIDEGGGSAAIFLDTADSVARFPEGLTARRSFSKAVALSEDRVLVVGGGDLAGSTVASTEIFGTEPTQPVEAVPLSILERIGHEALWLPEGSGEWAGRVAVIGGTTGSDNDTWDTAVASAIDSVALIDPTSGIVEEDVAFFESGVLGARAAINSDGLLAVVGGIDESGNHLSSVSILVPGANLALEGPAFSGRHLHQLTEVQVGGQQRFVVTGGLDSTGLADQIELWDGSQTSQFSAPPGAVLQTPRARHQAVPLSFGRVLIAGGATDLTDRTDQGTSLGSAEIFDPVAGTVVPSNDALDVPRQRHVAVPIPGDRVLICAGQDSAENSLSSCEIYDSETDSFSGFPGGSMTPGGPGIAAAALPDGRVFFVGGGESSETGTFLYIYTPPDWQD
ncbi:MAG: kelch repeat-containing protein [Myxococcota bacterium]|nr:kelch repeat-containing protein [Myxococcota bacterium]